MPQVTIHRREVTERLNPVGNPEDGVQVTYSTLTIPPTTIFIANPNATDDDVAAAIRQDIDARKQTPGPTLSV